jgi:hypothetical protein
MVVIIDSSSSSGRHHLGRRGLRRKVGRDVELIVTLCVLVCVWVCCREREKERKREREFGDMCVLFFFSFSPLLCLQVCDRPSRCPLALAGTRQGQTVAHQRVLPSPVAHHPHLHAHEHIGHHRSFTSHTSHTHSHISLCLNSSRVD